MVAGAAADGHFSRTSVLLGVVTASTLVLALVYLYSSSQKQAAKSQQRLPHVRQTKHDISIVGATVAAAAAAAATAAAATAAALASAAAAAVGIAAAAAEAAAATDTQRQPAQQAALEADHREQLLAKAREATDRGYQRLQEIKYAKYKEEQERKEAEEQKKKEQGKKGWSQNSQSIGQKAAMQAEKAVQLAADSGMSPEDLLRFRHHAPEGLEEGDLLRRGGKQQLSPEDDAKGQRLTSVSEEGSNVAQAQDPESSWRAKENNAHK